MKISFISIVEGNSDKSSPCCFRFSHFECVIYYTVLNRYFADMSMDYVISFFIIGNIRNMFFEFYYSFKISYNCIYLV